MEPPSKMDMEEDWEMFLYMLPAAWKGTEQGEPL